ncbi:MAG TPA: PfkB family carbohydrate kinase [Terracidiphilus sp.]|nr:PfkB family carbohydrate kinase [Terracidiphilus sp.]
MKEPHLILGLGELLWDVLPEGPRLGGAPANFTVMAGRLGSHAVLLSRIGRDDLGRKAIERLDPLPADAGFVETDPVHETGRVTVYFEGGQPHYTIHQPAAWDFLELSDEWVRLAERADAICFGSLAQRSLESRQTIQTLAAQTSSKCVRVFDVNLRAPFFSGEVIQESLELATVMKMNDAEVPQVLSLLGLTGGDGTAAGEARTDTLRAGAERLLGEFPTLEMVAVTRGGHGSLLVTRDEWHEHRGLPVKVADTIGAGDAFTAALTHYLLRGADLPTLNEAGNRWGGWVASQSGAMPPLADEVRAGIEAAIEG